MDDYLIEILEDFQKVRGKIFFVQRPRRGGQDPGGLLDKINEYSLLQPSFLLENMKGGCSKL